MIKIWKRIINLFKPSKYSIKIFIENAGFENRGDQLMIQAVVEQIRQYKPYAQILVQKDIFLQNPTYCIQNKIYPMNSRNTGLKNSKIYSKIVNTLLGDDWINTPREMDLILDCCGYRFADCWIQDESMASSLAQYYKSFCKNGRKLIMLPQAFGPFSNAASKKAMDVIYNEAESIYAREQQSYNYLKSLYPEANKISIVPDFTCLIKPENSSSIELPSKEYVLVIPNSRMLDKTVGNVSNSYLKFMTNIVEYLQANEECVYFLNHEGLEDEQLLRRINATLDVKIPILSDLTGQAIKSIIKHSKLLISARYHGVVSGLTQGVPTLCTSWSHKYQELLKEHQCLKNNLYVDMIDASIETIHDALLHPGFYVSKESCEEKVEELVNDMWKEIFEKINK